MAYEPIFKINANPNYDLQKTSKISKYLIRYFV